MKGINVGKFSAVIHVVVDFGSEIKLKSYLTETTARNPI